MRITSRISISTFLLIATMGSLAQAQVILTSDRAEDTIEGKFTANQVLPVEFALSAQGDTGIFGVDFAIDCGDSPIRIRSAAFDSAWPNAVGDQDFTLPGQRFRIIRSQPPGNMNRTLGANSQSTPFATVEFEVLSADAFEAACTILLDTRGPRYGPGVSRTKASILGQPDTTTIVMPANPGTPTGPSSGVSR